MDHMPKKRLLIFAAGLLLLFSFYLFSRQIKRGFLKQTDFNITVKIQDKVPHRLDEFWEDMAFFVTPIPSVFLLGLLTLAALIDFKNRKIRFKALVIPLLFGLMIGGEIYGKNVVHHPAPPFFMIKNPTTIFPTHYINEQFSYPSGHTARAVFLGMIFLSVLRTHLAFFTRKKGLLVGAVGITAYIVVVALGRIYLGHHCLSDIIGGALLSIGFGLLSYSIIL
jgi:membrane-associated phospholipid phosphatase